MRFLLLLLLGWDIRLLQLCRCTFNEDYRLRSYSCSTPMSLERRRIVFFLHAVVRFIPAINTRPWDFDWFRRGPAPTAVLGPPRSNLKLKALRRPSHPRTTDSLRDLKKKKEKSATPMAYCVYAYNEYITVKQKMVEWCCCYATPMVDDGWWWIGPELRSLPPKAVMQ